MPNRHTRILVAIFFSSIGLHIYLQHKIAACRQPRDRSFYSGWFSAGWPYGLAWASVAYVLPKIVFWLGFGPLGVIPHSIAAWIQSVYGISSLFSMLQSIGARGTIPSSFLNLLNIGNIIQRLRHLFWSDDYITQCVNYYESWLTYLNVIDFVLLSFYAAYYFSFRR